MTYKVSFATLVTKLRASSIWLVSEMGGANLFLLLLLIGITFFPLFFVGFTTNDDATIAINFGENFDLLHESIITAQMQGRFMFLWAYPLLRLPYLIDNQAWYLFLKFGAIFLVLASLYFSIRQIFRSTWLAFTSVLFFIGFIQNGWDHNALTSYPVAFNIYAASFLISLGLFSTAIDRKKTSLATLSGIFYFFSLGSELFVLFYPVYFVILLSRGVPAEPIFRRLKSGVNFLLSITLPLLIYLIIYFIWRQNFPSGYDGNNLNGFNILAACKVIGSYSLAAFPLASLKFMLDPESQWIIAHVSSRRMLLSELSAVNFIKPAVFGFLFATLMNTKYSAFPKQRVLAIGAVLAFIGIFIPNILLGFVQKHQDWVASGSHSYLYTYYSFISAAVFLSLFAAYLKVKALLWPRALRRAFTFFCIIIVMMLSFVVEVRNGYVALDQKLSHRKWQLMDEVIKSPAFKSIPDGSIVIAPTLSAHHRGIMVVPIEYWSKYTKHKTGKAVQFVDDKCIDGLPCFSLIFRQALKTDNQFVILSKIDDMNLQTSKDLVVYSIPKLANSMLIGSFVPGPKSPQLKVNDIPADNVSLGFFSSSWPRNFDNSLVQAVHVAGNVDIIPDQITISQYDIMTRPGQLVASLGDGFYGWEVQSGQPSLVWSKDVSELRIVNYDEKSTIANVMFEASSLEKINLHASGASKTSFLVTPGQYTPIQFSILVPPGISSIVLRSNRPAITPGNDDKRFLSFSIRELHLIKNKE